MMSDSVDARQVTAKEGLDSTDPGVDCVDAKPQADAFQYNMSYSSVGQCVIINNKNFEKKTGMGVRNGTDEDAKNVMQTFTKLGFKCKVSNDQTVSQMRSVLSAVSKEDHSKSAMFACVLLSHGEDGRIYGTDGCIELKELFALLRGNRCKSLVGKPKLFFIQLILMAPIHCRGSIGGQLVYILDDLRKSHLVGPVNTKHDNDTVLKIVKNSSVHTTTIMIKAQGNDMACRGSDLDAGCVETDSVGEEETQRIPVEADFLYVYSTAPGYYAWRNVANGSWFIFSLCEMLAKYGKQLEIIQIMTRVNHKVAMDFKSSSNLPGFDGMKQIPCIVSMLTKELFFPK